MATVFPGKNYLDKKSGDLTPLVKTGDQAAARVIVAGSNAFSVATPVQIEPWLRRGEFRVLDFREPWMKFDSGFIYRQDRMLAPAAEAFMQHVREIETEVNQRNQSLITDLAISVQKRLNKWTGFTGLCNSVNPVNPVIFLVPATGCTRCRVSNFRLKMYFFY
jgi:hypothetical protein